MMARASYCSRINSDGHTRPTSYGRIFCTRCFNGLVSHVADGTHFGMALRRACWQTARRLPLYRGSYATRMRRPRWEYTDTLSEISNEQQ